MQPQTRSNTSKHGGRCSGPVGNIRCTLGFHSLIRPRCESYSCSLTLLFIAQHEALLGRRGSATVSTTACIRRYFHSSYEQMSPLSTRICYSKASSFSCRHPSQSEMVIVTCQTRQIAKHPGLPRCTRPLSDSIGCSLIIQLLPSLSLKRRFPPSQSLGTMPSHDRSVDEMRFRHAFQTPLHYGYPRM